MLQSSVDQVDQLQRRSDELDAREVYLAIREKLAESTEAAITKGQHDLALLDSTILARETILSQQEGRMLTLDKEYARKQTILEHAILKKQEQCAKWDLKLEELQNAISGIKTSIAEREQYYKQQETLIVKQAEEGNLQLRGLEYEIIESKQVIKDLEVKKQNIYSEQKALESDLQTARDNFAPELATHEASILVIMQRGRDEEEKILIASTKLHNLIKETNVLLIKRQQIHDDVDAKLQILDTKEREIMAKRETLRQEQESMDEARHYYKDPKSLYGTI